MAALIEVSGLTYSYPGQENALNHVDLEIHSGRTVAVLGGNGAGKSTLFLILNGVLSPASGQLSWLGQRVVTSGSKGVELRKKVGIVFQDPNDQLFSDNVRDDIAFGLLNMGLAQSEVEFRVNQVIELLDIGTYAHKPTHALSFGQKKRVALAGVLAMQPEVVILDEPTAGLDPAGITEMFNLLEQLKKERGITLILSTHDIDLVALYCDDAYVLDRGQIAFKGTVTELIMQADMLRHHSLRLPRIAHLMEILATIDGLPVDRFAATISQARHSLAGLFSPSLGQGGDQ